MTEISFRDMMELEAHGPETFVATGPRYPWGGLYGGQIIAQALRAATLTIEPDYMVHSLHGYFIRLGDASEPIRLEVDRIRNGRSFLTRRVVARQSVGAILNMSASFHRPEAGQGQQTQSMPAVTAPDKLKPSNWSPLFERRCLDRDIGPGRVGAWMRLIERFGDDRVLNACALAYLSDDMATDAVVARHPDRPPNGLAQQTFWSASLDHAMWFHRPANACDWHLHDYHCRELISTRGLSFGNIFDEHGNHVASVAQEVLIRPARPR